MPKCCPICGKSMPATDLVCSKLCGKEWVQRTIGKAKPPTVSWQRLQQLYDPISRKQLYAEQIERINKGRTVPYVHKTKR